MSEIEFKRVFIDLFCEPVKTWAEAAEVTFSTWVDPELVEEAKKRLMTRAKNWQAKHTDTYIATLEKVKAYNGEIILALTVRKNESDRNF